MTSGISIWSKDVQSLKASDSTLIASDALIYLRLEHPWNALTPSTVARGTDTNSKSTASSKAPSPITIAAGKSILVKAVFLKASCPKEVTAAALTIVVRLVVPSKAPALTIDTRGMSTEVRPVQPLKAFAARIVCTGSISISPEQQSTVGVVLVWQPVVGIDSVRANSDASSRASSSGSADSFIALITQLISGNRLCSRK